MSLFSAEKVSELDRFWQRDGARSRPDGGKFTFRFTSALATLLLLILQPPVGFIAPSLFMLFLVSHDTPYQCFKGLLTCISARGPGNRSRPAADDRYRQSSRSEGGWPGRIYVPCGVLLPDERDSARQRWPSGA